MEMTPKNEVRLSLILQEVTCTTSQRNLWRYLSAKSSLPPGGSRWKIEDPQRIMLTRVNVQHALLQRRRHRASPTNKEGLATMVGGVFQGRNVRERQRGHRSLGSAMNTLHDELLPLVRRFTQRASRTHTELGRGTDKHREYPSMVVG